MAGRRKCRADGLVGALGAKEECYFAVTLSRKLLNQNNSNPDYSNNNILFVSEILTRRVIPFRLLLMNSVMDLHSIRKEGRAALLFKGSGRGESCTFCLLCERVMRLLGCQGFLNTSCLKNCWTTSGVFCCLHRSTM